MLNPEITIVLTLSKPSNPKSPSVDLDVDFVVAKVASQEQTSCKVVLEDILIPGAAEKLQLNSQDAKAHMSLSQHTTDEKYLQGLDLKTPIAWGTMKDERWSEFDSAVASKLHPSNSLSERVKLLEDTIYEEGSKIFGFSKPKVKNLSGRSRRTIKSIKLIILKNSFQKQIDSCLQSDQKLALEDLLSKTRLKIRLFRRSERSRRKRAQFKQAQRAFKSNPYEAGKDLLNPKSCATLNVDQSTLDSHKESVVSDKTYDIPLEELAGLPQSPEITKPFNSTSLKAEDFERLLSSRRNKSSPGLNAIRYIVYKKCSQISNFLFNIFKSCLKHCIVPIQWRYAKEVYIPKSNSPDPSKIKDFRPIALLNVEGKLFFSLVSRRLENHIITNNKFINTSVQKGCMEKVPGCWEHMSVVWGALKEARASKSSLATVWLDIANAYGSIPHKLIFFALKRYGVSLHWIDLIKCYYQGLYSKSFSNQAPSDWHQHFRGIFAGCTLSIILFLAAINIIIEYTLAAPVDPVVLAGSTSLPLIRAFMDDINLMSSSVKGTQTLLERCAEALTWAGMDFRAEKSRSLVIVKGRSLQTTPFFVSPPKNATDFSVYIPSIHSQPLRFLGRIIDGSMSDRKSIDELKQKLLDGLEVIQKSSFTGIQKLWILQHLLIPRIQWALLIYEVSMTLAKQLEQKVSTYIRKWLHLHHSTSSICIYSKSSPCPLPIKSLTSILKASKISGHLLLRDSKDPLVSNCKIQLKCGKWVVEEIVNTAEAELKFRQITGPTQNSKAGLGLLKSKAIPKNKSSHEYRKLISETAKEIDEECVLSKAHQLKVQGQWAKWDHYVKNDFSWSTILSTPLNLLSFCLASTFGVLPSPNNLKHWCISTESSCSLCKAEVCTAPHILSGCQVALNQGRFSFRHDSVLKELFETLNSFLSDLPDKPCSKINKVKFVKSGKCVPKSKPTITGTFHLADDWVTLADLGGSYVFPGHIAITSLRPDIVVYSNSTKRVILIELTCPCEENLENQHDFKNGKYAGLVTMIRQNSWQVNLFAVEVGARGYCSKSVISCLKTLGFPTRSVYSCAKKLGHISMQCSFVIWMARNSKHWKQEATLSPTCHFASNKDAQKSRSQNKQVVSLPSSANPVIIPTKKPVGLHNKGNTCYANSILQALTTVPSVWSKASSEGPNISLLCRSVSLTMSSIAEVNTTFDPSSFLCSLQSHVSANQVEQFNFNTQQDAAHILGIILDELKGRSLLADEIFSISYESSVVCSECTFMSTTEERLDMLPLQPSRSIQESVNKFLEVELLQGANRYNCPLCQSPQEATIQKQISRCGNVLICHLKRFGNFLDNTYKDCSHFQCLPAGRGTLAVPVSVEGVISFSKQYTLVATINHSGKLQNGHYWAFIKSGDCWYKCNDTSVVKVRQSELNNSSSYILVFKCL